MTEIQHGLEGVVAFETQIAEPDKEGSALRYRGVDIEDIVGRVPFENVWGLLVDGSYSPGLPPAEPYNIAIHTGDVRERHFDVLLHVDLGLRLADLHEAALGLPQAPEDEEPDAEKDEGGVLKPIELAVRGLPGVQQAIADPAERLALDRRERGARRTADPRPGPRGGWSPCRADTESFWTTSPRRRSARWSWVVPSVTKATLPAYPSVVTRTDIEQFGIAGIPSGMTVGGMCIVKR